MSHTCHWPDCAKEVHPKMWGCKTHWFRLPKELRDLIWATYRPGQEITKTPGRAYVNAAQKVQDWIARHLAKKVVGPASADMFGDLIPPKPMRPPRKPRQFLMHVWDAGDNDRADAAERPIIVTFRCGRCKHETEWRSMRTHTEAKRGIPCARCNV
jgi:DNA-directed RNA polymerase subunit RPC12/RpoP